MKELHQLFAEEIKDMYSSEHQIVKALQKLINEAHEEKLKDALRHHLEETKEQIKRLEEIGREFHIDYSHAYCPTMEAILREGKKLMDSHFPPEVKDAALISAAQRVEHYEMAAYGTLKSFAKQLKLKTAQDLIEKTLKEESAADHLLTKIAEGTIFTKGVNKKAKEHESV